MHDYAGHREEFSWGFTWSLNYRNILSGIEQIYAFKENEEMQKKAQNYLSFFNGALLPNFHASLSWSRIEDLDVDGVREGQKRLDYTLGFKLIGEIPGIKDKISRDNP